MEIAGIRAAPEEAGPHIDLMLGVNCRLDSDASPRHRKKKLVRFLLPHL
jgi:hypothetical protein